VAGKLSNMFLNDLETIKSYFSADILFSKLDYLWTKPGTIVSVIILIDAIIG
jgi:hypothetical protein